jgi:4-diphosphocytidyl-2-C-methyl-D-erythritol kinase
LKFNSTYGKLKQQSKAGISSDFLHLLRYYVIFEHDCQRNDQHSRVSAISSSPASCMNLRAYAKINIGLRILLKRSDGYHDIETIFHQINLYDELSFEPAAVVKLTTSSPGIPHDSTNLCLRAAQLLREHAGRREGIEIKLAKHVPVGAGLGGGSSDAAAVLVALNTLWMCGIQHHELVSLASQLGSDVPFFIQGGTAVGTSRGEVLEYFTLSIPYWILTVTPPVHISTAWAYSHVQLETNAGAKPLRTLVEETLTNPGETNRHIRNDFQELVFNKYPEVRNLKTKLESSGAIFVQLSGSGSSLFGFFRDETAARTLMSELASTCSVSLTAPNFSPKEIISL